MSAAHHHYREIEEPGSTRFDGSPIDDSDTDDPADLDSALVIERLSEENDALRAYLDRVMVVLQQRTEPERAEPAEEPAVVTSLDERRSAARPWSRHPSVDHHPEPLDSTTALDSTAALEHRLSLVEHALAEALDVMSVLLRER